MVLVSCHGHGRASVKRRRLLAVSAAGLLVFLFYYHHRPSATEAQSSEQSQNRIEEPPLDPPLPDTDGHSVNIAQALDVPIAEPPFNFESPSDTEGAHSNTLVLYGKQRSGSTFAMGFLWRDREVFNLYEPLNQLHHTFLEQGGGGRLAEFLRCDYRQINANPDGVQRRHNWISRIFCKMGCYMNGQRQKGLTIWKHLCEKAEYRSAKVIKLPRLEQLGHMVEQGLKVWVQFRDPRGVMASRKKLGNYGNKWNITIDSDSRKYCSQALSDLKWIRDLYRKIGSHTFPVLPFRYEDLAKYPIAENERLYKLWGRPAPVETTDYIKNHILSSAKGSNPVKETFSVDRANSSTTPWDWRWKFPYHEVEIIQSNCVDYMKELGYLSVNSHEQLKQKQLTLIEEATFKWNDILSGYL